MNVALLRDIGRKNGGEIEREEKRKKRNKRERNEKRKNMCVVCLPGVNVNFTAFEGYGKEKGGKEKGKKKGKWVLCLPGVNVSFAAFEVVVEVVSEQVDQVYRVISGFPG